MKKLSLIVLLLSVFVMKAQSFQGKAFYQTKRNFEFKTETDSTKSKNNPMVDEDMKKAIKEMIRKQSEKTYILTFNKNESIYKKQEELAAPKPKSGFSIEIVDGNELLYKNTKDKTYVKSQENFGKKFLISDKIIPLEWKMSKETKMIGKYLCIKATTIKKVDDFDKNGDKKEQQKVLKIVAWYTPEIPVSSGPELYTGLPGLILELHEDKMHYVCNKIVLNPKEKIAIAAPKKGKKINQKDYDELMQKKEKEMIEQFKNKRKKDGKGNSFTITIGG